MVLIKVLALLLGSFSFLVSIWTIIPSPGGVMGGVVWLPKLWAGAWAPILAAVGILGAVLGLISRDGVALLAGLLGAVLATRHTLRVIRHADFLTQAFGAGWEQGIPASLKARLWSKQYRLCQPGSPRVPGTRNLSMATSSQAEDQVLFDLWEPPAGVERTGLALIYFHGGLWQALDKDFLTQPLFRHLAGQGHVVMDVAYSLAPAADLARMLADVKQAIVWMKTNASNYGVDPQRIVLMGVSGGGHLALLAAYASELPAFQVICPGADMSVRAVVAMSGITDMSAFFSEYGRTTVRQPELSSQISVDMRPFVHDRTWLDRLMTRTRAFPAYRHANMPGGILLLVELMGGTLKEIPQAYRQASPLEHVGPHCPPTLQFCAEDDFVVNVSHGRRLDQALRNCGATSVYIEYPATVHGFDQYIGVNRRIAPAAQSATYFLERFLARMASPDPDR
jgi:acetyl esterase/lipase